MNTYTFQDYIKAFVRRKWLIALIILATTAGALGLAEFLPKRYKSTTLIVVESQKVPETYVRGVVSGSVRERLGTIRQVVLSRKLLSQVIEDVGLVQEGAKGISIDELIELIRANLEITTSRDEAFSISFRSGNPITAMNVTARVADVFIQENLKSREQMVEKATAFLLGELNTAKEELEIKEKAISEFKLRYMGELPGQLEANLRSLDRLQVEVATRTEALHRLNDRLDSTERAINEFQATGTILAPTTAPTQAAATVANTKPNRLRELEHRLVALSAMYKDTYPDVISLKEEIAQLKALPDIVEPDKTVAVSRPPEAKPVVSPILRELQQQQLEIKKDIEATKDVLARLNTQKKLHEFRVDNTPTREQQLATLTRDYENMQRNYQTLLDKRLNARIAENLERKQQGEQFRVIDPANLPESPEFPDKFRFVLVGLGVGCALGFGSAVMLEQMRTVFQDAEGTEHFLGIPVLGTIPDFHGVHGGELRVRQKSMRRGYLPLRDQGESGRNPTDDPVSSRRGVAWSNGPEAGVDRPVGRKSAVPLHVDQLNFVAKWNPTSVVAEQYRVAATRLVLMNSHRKSSVVLVTSAVNGEGKTSSALNMGYVLARDLGKSVLIVDCDLKRPRLNRYAGLPQSPGVAEVLQMEKPAASCIQQIDGGKLSILTAGTVTNQSVFLHELEKLDSILEELRHDYEYVLLDAPPIYPLADINVLAHMADVVMVVVRAGNTQKELVRKAVVTLRDNPEKAALLTGVSSEDAPVYFKSEYYLQPMAKA